MTPTRPHQFRSTAEAARHLGISEQQLAYVVRCGHVDPVMVGRSRLWSDTEIEVARRALRKINWRAGSKAARCVEKQRASEQRVDVPERAAS